jgi:hypothetical protein
MLPHLGLLLRGVGRAWTGVLVVVGPGMRPLPT